MVITAVGVSCLYTCYGIFCKEIISNELMPNYDEMYDTKFYAFYFGHLFNLRQYRILWKTRLFGDICNIVCLVMLLTVVVC